MVLMSKNRGKFLTNEYEDLTNKGVKDRTQLTAEEIEFIELGDDEGHGKENPETYEIDSTPVDPETQPKKLDLRDSPQKGGKE